MSDFEKYKYKNNFTFYNKLTRLIWGVIWNLFFRTTPRWAFNSWRIFLLKLFGANIGIGCKVLPSCYVWAPWNLVMGDYSVLSDGVDCYSMDKVIIGSKVAISQRTFICTGSHDIRSLTRPLITKPIVISDHAWICAEVFIGPGVEIKTGAIVAARSVVVRNVENYQIVAGNPAKFIKMRVLYENI